MEENTLKNNFYVIIYGGMLLAYSFLIMKVFPRVNWSTSARTNQQEYAASTYQIPTFDPFNIVSEKQAESKKTEQFNAYDDVYADLLTPNVVKFQTPKLNNF